MHLPSILLVLCKGSQILAAPVSSGREETLNLRATAHPFTRIIAFGDDFTDNGSGSFAHKITGNPKTGEGIHLWGANTWTDGPVAVTYLARNLRIPVAYDYAFGSAGGGAVIGSVCNNSLLDPKKLTGHAKISPGKLVPDTLEQIGNYSTSGVYNTDMNRTLHFFWTGNNDMIASLGWAGRFTICSRDTLCHPGQQKFIANVISCMTNGLMNLINAGAKHILVPNVYPRNLSPWTSQYISAEPGMIADFDEVITQTNNRLKEAITQINALYGSNIMYYDVNALMKAALQNSSIVQGAAYNYTCVDGCVQQIPGNVGNWNTYWQNTIIKHQPDDFYWMTTVMPSTTVMKAIGIDMARFLRNQVYL